VGRSLHDETCIYAWQRLSTSDQKLSLINSRVATSVRLRLCAPNSTEAALIAPMMNLSIDAGLSGGGWAPEPKQLSADIGAPGALMGPPALMEAIANPAPAPAAATPRRPTKSKTLRPMTKTTPIADAPSSPVGGVIVPAPPGEPSDATAPRAAPVAVPSPPTGARS
jgi:cellulose biosynthesis protein BcsN